MTTIRVVWGSRTPIGPDKREELRTMTRDFGSAKKAAEFACDVIYVLAGPEAANGHSDKFYIVGRDKPRARYEHNTRDWWVEVQWEPYPSDRRREPRIPAPAPYTL